MSNYIQYFRFLCVLLSAVLIYLLTKIIIERNENSLAITKLLGVRRNEVCYSKEKIDESDWNCDL